MPVNTVKKPVFSTGDLFIHRLGRAGKEFSCPTHSLFEVSWAEAVRSKREFLGLFAVKELFVADRHFTAIGALSDRFAVIAAVNGLTLVFIAHAKHRSFFSGWPVAHCGLRCSWHLAPRLKAVRRYRLLCTHCNASGSSPTFPQ